MNIICLASSRSQNDHVITSPNEKDEMTAGLAFHFSTLMSKLQKDPDVCKGRFHRFISYGVDTDEPSPISHSFLHCVNVMALQRAPDSGVALAPIRLRRSRPHYVAL